ncbi:hypothetical protein HQO89_04830 [Rhodococcus fascians]|nr:hypothetical protein [Rhodococcus fascians]
MELRTEFAVPVVLLWKFIKDAECGPIGEPLDIREGIPDDLREISTAARPFDSTIVVHCRNFGGSDAVWHRWCGGPTDHDTRTDTLCGFTTCAWRSIDAGGSMPYPGRNDAHYDHRCGTDDNDDDCPGTAM